MTELYLLRLIPIAAVLAAFWLLMWHFWGGNRKKAVENLEKHFQGKIYPETELAEALRTVEKEKKRRLQLRDLASLHITPEQEMINTEVIMDGRIIHENLKRLGFNPEWLEKQLKEQHYDSAKEIYLGICDKDNKLSLFPVE